jgi:hypothetical protein
VPVIVWANTPEKGAKVVKVRDNPRMRDFKTDFMVNNIDFSRFKGFIVDYNPSNEN